MRADQGKVTSEKVYIAGAKTRQCALSGGLRGRSLLKISPMQPLISEINAFLDEYAHLAPTAGDSIGSQKTRAWQKLLVQKGYACRSVPKQYGGFGAEPDPIALRTIAYEFSKRGLRAGMANQGISMLAPTLLSHGSEEQKARYLPPTIAGDMVWCQGYSEPGAGSDLAAVRTKAVRDGDDLVINGSKIWTSTARDADMMFGLFRTDQNAPKHQGISYVLVPMDTQGIEVRPLLTMTGNAEFNEVFFENVRVPAANIVGQANAGWKVAMTTLKHERAMLGDPFAAQANFRDAFAILQARHNELEGLERAEFVRRFTDMEARLEALTACELEAFQQGVEGKSGTLQQMVIKLLGCEFNHQLARLVLDLVGLDGSGWRGDYANWHWRSMFTIGLIIGGGTEHVQKNLIAERALGMPRGGGVLRTDKGASPP